MVQPIIHQCNYISEDKHSTYIPQCPNTIPEYTDIEQETPTEKTREKVILATLASQSHIYL